MADQGNRSSKIQRSAQPRCCAVHSRHRHPRAAVETRTFESLRVCSDEQQRHRIRSYDHVLPLGIKLCQSKMSLQELD